MLATQIEVSDGTLNIINVGIEFFNQADISVSLDQSELPLVLGVDYQWSTATSIQFLNTLTTPGGLVPAGVEVIIRRNTKTDEMFNIYDGGAPFSRLTLDENFEQLLFLSQEFSEGLGLDGLRNNLNMNGYRVTNLGDPVDDDDSATKGYVDAGNSKNIRTPEDIPVLPIAASRAGKVLGFDGAGNPVASLPTSGSGTELALDLLNAEDPAKGASLVRIKLPLPNTISQTITQWGTALVNIEMFGFVGGLFDGTTAANNLIAYNNAIASGHKSFLVPADIYALSDAIQIPTGVRFFGLGAPILGFGTIDDKQWLRPGYKHLMPGSSFLFQGTGTLVVSAPQRIDDYATVRPLVQVVNVGIGSSGAAVNGMALIQDMDCFDALGTATKPGFENKADYEGGLYIDDAARTRVKDVCVFGYFPKAGIIISSRLGNDDPDYNSFEGGSTMGRHGIALLGSNNGAASHGLSSTRVTGMGIYVLDHHARGSMTVPELTAYYATANTWRNVYIDGDIAASSAEINGHYFHMCEIRSRANHQLELDHASNVHFHMCVFEFTPYGITNSDTPSFIGSANVKRGVSFTENRNNFMEMITAPTFAGVIPVPIRVSGDPLNGRYGVISKTPSGSYTAVVLGSDGNIGDCSVQFTRDLNNGSSGWRMFMDESASDTLNFRHSDVPATSALAILTTGERIPAAGERRYLHEVGPLLTIAGGAITVTRSDHAITIAGGTGDLVTINGGVAGMRLRLHPGIAGNVITLKRSGGNIRLDASTDKVLNGTLSQIELYYNGTVWMQTAAVMTNG